MQHYHRFLFLWVLLGASACAEPQHAASVSGHAAPEINQAIVHGRQAEANDPFDAVVKLSFVNNRTMCSGTLIAPDTVLTAAHCLPQAWQLGSGVQRLNDAQRIEVVFHRGRNVTTARTARAVAVHDGYRGLLRCGQPVGLMEHKACETYVRQCGGLTGDAQEFCLSSLDKQARRGLGLDRLWPTHDVAVVFLDTPVTDLTPAHITDDHCCSDLVHVHAPVVVVGYGQQGDTAFKTGAMGSIQHGRNHIVETGVGELRIDGGDKAHPCFGDSGGPVYAEVEHDGHLSLIQVGVASRVWDYHKLRGCASGLAYTRVDDEGGFIGSSMRDACTEGARQHCDDASGPKLDERPWREHESCQQGSASWGCVLLMAMWLLARRGMRQAT